MYKRHLGFTLLEILIAIFIFTIISTITATAIHTVFTNQSSTEKRAVRLGELQLAMLLITRDFEQTIHRPITNNAGVLQGFIGKYNTVNFTHAGLTNPFSKSLRSNMQRTAYELTDGKLIRLTWDVLDQVTTSKPSSRIILKDVTELRFEYLNDKNIFLKDWPPSDQKFIPLPRAVRITLTLKNWGTISQLYIIPRQAVET